MRAFAISPILAAFLFPLALFPARTAAASQGPVTTKEEAAELVISQLLGGNADSVFLYVTFDPVTVGEVIYDYEGAVLTAPSDGWVAFIDDYPRANWMHSCRYVFIDRDSGDLLVYDRSWPPESLGILFWPYTTEAFSAFCEADFIVTQPPTPPSNMTYAPGEKYAVIINGGGNKWMNYLRYWNDVQFIFITLTGVYRFEKDNVFVLFSDGLSDTADMYTGGMPIDSPKDLDEDGSPDFDGPATLAAVDSVFELLAERIRLNDMLLVYMTDHGGSYGGQNTFAVLWDGDALTDSHLRDLLLDLTQCRIMTVLEPCYSGGFMDELGVNEPGGMGRGFASACRYDELSWAFPDYKYDVFVYFWTSAISQLNPLDIGDPTFADENADGMISFEEAFLYAEWMDYLWLGGLETPQYTDDPEGLGEYMFLGNRFWGGPICVPFEDIHPRSLGARPWGR